MPKPTPDPAPRIGLEVHVQLAAQTKLFCACPPDGLHTCPTCQGHPGTLPVLAHDAVALGVRAALALAATPNPTSGWARKHYDWPDLPKGYQLTQGAVPLACDGVVAFDLVNHGAGGSTPRNAPGVVAPESSLRLLRLHLEEDAGRLRDGVPDDGRAGVALIEIVTAPTLSSPEEVEAALRAIHRTLVDAGVTEGRLEAGHFRADLNVSLDTPGAGRIEIKNVSGFRGAARAVEDEIARQRDCLARGEPLGPGTRAWSGETSVPLREKPSTAGYRLLDDPDLGAFVVTPNAMAEAQAALDAARELLDRRRATYASLTADVRATLEADGQVARVWDDAVTAGGEPLVMGRLVQRTIVRRVQTGEMGVLTGQHLATTQVLIEGGVLAREALPQLLDALARHGGEARAMAEQLGLLGGMDDAMLVRLVAGVLAAEPAMTARWRGGDEAAGRFLVGQAMRATGRKVPAPRVVAALTTLRTREDGT